jgi:hypothetical protein
MHRKILEDATHEQLKYFLLDTFDDLKKVDREMYEELEEDLYKEVYGCHFNKWLLEKALSKMQNEDGTIGGHWTLEQTNSVAKSNGISFDYFNEYDWNYVMNMIYSDYYGAIPDDLNYYVKLSKKFLDDKDAGRGKAYHYYMAIKK